jgi:hypothetical protein
MPSIAWSARRSSARAQSEVVAPVPEKLGAKPTESWLTLTSCHPKFSAAQRYITFAKLDRIVPRTAGPPPELTAAPAAAAAAPAAAIADPTTWPVTSSVLGGA